MEDKLNLAINRIAEQQWCVIEDFFPPSLCQSLYSELLNHRNAQILHPAKIGKNDQQQRLQEFRGDSILWLDGSTRAQQTFLNIMEQYRLLLNQEFYLGLHELEAHFAVYSAGTGYKKHLDSFKNNNLRRITIITYLTPSWSPEDRGELVIYDKNEEVITTVQPLTGTLVSFVSEEFPHEVSITHSERASIAGWFRVRP